MERGQIKTLTFSDDSGTMEFTEFVAMMSSSAKDQDIEDDLREAFRVFDKEGKKGQK